MKNDSTRRTTPTETIADDPTVVVRPYSGDGMPNFSECSFRYPVDPIEVDWADTHLAGLEVIARRETSGLKIKVWQDKSGRWWREAGTITLLPWGDGRLGFTIITRAGANEADIEFFENVVKRAMEGQFLRYGWQPFTAGDGRTGWQFTSSRRYADPFIHTDPTLKLFPCTDSRCAERWHSDVGEDHVAERIDNGEFRIAVTRYFDPEQDDESYSVYIDVDEPGKGMTPEQVASLVSDLQWAAETARRANATPNDPHAKGFRDPEGYKRRRAELKRTSFCFAEDPENGTNCLESPGHVGEHRSLSTRWNAPEPASVAA